MEMSCFIIAAMLGLDFDGCGKPYQPVLPVVVYRDHFYTQTRLRDEYQDYVVLVRPLRDSGVRITWSIRGNPKNDFESLFIRDQIMAIGTNDAQAFQFPTASVDKTYYLSPDRLTEARWIPLEPNGKPIEYLETGPHTEKHL